MSDRPPVRRVEIDTSLDRRAAEALMLEIRLLARRFGAEVVEARVEMVPDGSAEERASGDPPSRPGEDVG